jgi:hypothetical protein
MGIDIDRTSGLDSVVARLSSEYDVDAEDVAAHADYLARVRFADARVTTFVPILIEKELRDVFRRLRADRVKAEESQSHDNVR